MPAQSSKEGVQISHAPSLIAFQLSLLHQSGQLWLDAEAKRLYCIVVKSVSCWSKDEIKFTGSFRFLAGAGVTWQDGRELWEEFYADLDDMSIFEATYSPESMTAKLFVDKGWLDKLVASTADGENHGVAVLLEDIPTQKRVDEAELDAENTKIMEALTGASGMFNEYAQKLEGSRLDIILFLNGLTDPSAPTED